MRVLKQAVRLKQMSSTIFVARNRKNLVVSIF